RSKVRPVAREPPCALVLRFGVAPVAKVGAAAPAGRGVPVARVELVGADAAVPVAEARWGLRVEVATRLADDEIDRDDPGDSVAAARATAAPSAARRSSCCRLARLAVQVRLNSRIPLRTCN